MGGKQRKTNKNTWTTTKFSGRGYLFLLHIMCGYQCDKAVTKKWNDIISLHWNDIISLHGFELSNQIDYNNLVASYILADTGRQIWREEFLRSFINPFLYFHLVPWFFLSM